MSLDEKNLEMLGKIERGIKQIFPIGENGSDKRIEFIKMNYPESLNTSNYNYTNMLSKKSEALYPLECVLKINGKEKNVKVLDYPIIFPGTGESIVGGNAYSPINLMVQRNGVYFSKKNDDDIQSLFVVSGARNFKIKFEPSTEKIMFLLHGHKFKSYNILKSLGISDSEMKRVMTEDVFEANKKDYEPLSDDFKKFITALEIRDVGKTETDEETSNDSEKRELTEEEKKQNQLKEDEQLKKDFFNKVMLDNEVNEITLGLKNKKLIDNEVILKSIDNIIKTYQNKLHPLTKESTVFKKIKTGPDFISSRLFRESPLIRRKIKESLLKGENVEEKINELLNKSVHGFYKTSQSSNLGVRINPLAIKEEGTKITIVGEGGIDESLITDEAKQAQFDSIGFKDPIKTPESSLTGVTLNLTKGSYIKDGKIVQEFVNAKTGRKEMVNHFNAFFKKIAFPDDYDFEKNKFKKDTVEAVYKNEKINIPSKDAELVIEPSKAFGIATNLIPALDQTQGNRAAMGSKQQTQAIPLVNREAPIFKSGFEEEAGEDFLIKSENSGKVEKVDEKEIVISGKIYEIPKTTHIGTGGILKFFPVVKVGDDVKKGDLIINTNFHEGKELSLGTNVMVAYMPYEGANIEDGLVISESAANGKFKSMHSKEYEINKGENIEIDINKYKNLFPMNVNLENEKLFNNSGIIKEGSEIKSGYLLIPAIRKKIATEEDVALSRLGKAIGSQLKDSGVFYEGDKPAKVSSVIEKDDSITVVVEYEAPLEVGDKLSNRYGGKGIVDKIVPDEEMPKTKDGKTIELIVNKIGIPSRINPSQTVETAINKSGTYTTKSFVDQDIRMKKAKENGSKEDIISPIYGEIKDVSIGPEYYMKLVHVIDKKVSERSNEGYTADETPSKGGGVGGQSIDHGMIYGLAAHGAYDFLQEAKSYKSQRNADLWDAIVEGRSLPKPKETFVYKKFNSILNAMGINTEKVGNSINYFPGLSGKTVDSAQEVEKPSLLDYNLNPDKGGLFDYKTFGGSKGEKWGKITLAAPVKNPLFENNISIVLGKDKDEIKSMKNQELYKELKNLDIDKTIEEVKNLKKISKTVSKTDQYNKRLKLLFGLKKAGIGAENYMLDKVPVLPPIYRPATADKNTNKVISHTFNELYKNVIEMNNIVKEKDKEMYSKTDDKRLQKVVDELYSGKTNDSGKEFKGLMTFLAGSTPKEGFYQSKVIKSRQDYSGRATITASTNLAPWEVGLPKNIGMKIFEPFVVRELKRKGYKPLEIMEMMDRKDPIAIDALKEVTKDRPVLLNRAPSLHRFSTMSFMPVVHNGKELQVHPLFTKPFNYDFDGDSSINSILCEISKIFVARNEKLCYNFFEEKNSKELSDMPSNCDIRFSRGLVNLRDFPRGELLEKTEKIEVYSVPEGVKVLTVWNNKEEWIKPESFHIHKGLNMINVETTAGKSVQISDDHSMVTVDENLDYKRFKAEIGITVPRVKKGLDIKEGDFIKKIKIEKLKESQYNIVKDDFELNEEMGYLLGVYIGDGWVSNTNNRNDLCLASENSIIPNRIKKIASKYFDREIKICCVDNPHKFEDFDCYCEKHTWSSTTFCKFLEENIGKGAENKHLPLFWMNTAEDFRWGLLAGLIDTDGTVTITKTKTKKKESFAINYNTNSRRLAYEIVGLGFSLGLTSNVTPTKTPKGNEHYVVCFSVDSIKVMQRRMALSHPDKKYKLSIMDISQRSGDGFKFTPKLTLERLKELQDSLGKKYAKKEATAEEIERINKNRSIYVVIDKVKKKNTAISLETAKNIFELDLEIFKNNPFWKKWKEMCLDPNIEWELVTSIKPIPHITEAYDLTIPPAYTFVAENGIVLYDTMSVHAAVSKEGNEDLKKIMAAKLIFNDSYQKTLNASIQDEQISGLYAATKSIDENSKVTTFHNIDELRRSFENNKLLHKPSDRVLVKGENSDNITSFGRALINSYIPKPYRDYQSVLNKSNINKLIMRFASSIKPMELAECMDNIRKAANFFATKYPISLGVEDLPNFASMKEKRIRETELKYKNLSGKERHKKVFDEVLKMNEEIKDQIRGKNNYLLLSEIGAKGNKLQTQQIIGMPGYVLDTENKVSKEPIIRNFGEGLRLGEFFSAIPGVRKGMIGRAQATAVPGALAKVIANNSTDQYISELDCKTSKGIEMDIDDPECIHRLTSVAISGTPKDTPITQAIVDELKKRGVKKIKVRSAETCESEKGMCSKCFGVDNYGELQPINTQIGLKAAQSISEPLTQAAMNAFHTGGLAVREDLEREQESNMPQGINAIQQAFYLSENRKGQGVICEEDSVVKNIINNSIGEKSIIMSTGKIYKVPMDREIIKKIGDRVNKGEMLTDGAKNMHILFNNVLDKNVEKFRSHLTNDIKNAYGSAGGQSRRIFEVMSRSMTNIAKITNPNENSGMLEGDYITLQEANSINKNSSRNVPVTYLLVGEELSRDIPTLNFKKNRKLSRKDIDDLKFRNIGTVDVKCGKIEFEPVVQGILMAPHKKFEDPLIRMNYNRIPKSLEEAASFGRSSILDSANIIPRIATTENISLKKE